MEYKFIIIAKWITPSNHTLYHCKILLIYNAFQLLTLADLSMVKAKPECTMSFSEAPAIFFWKLTDGIMGIRPTSENFLSNDSCTDSEKANLWFREHTVGNGWTAFKKMYLRNKWWLESLSYLKVSRPYDTWLIFFNHSKKDTVTPPAFVYRSGMIKTFFLIRISSAAGVRGPLAASAII